MNRLQMLKPARLVDERGWLQESYKRRTAASVGIDLEFVQDNHSLSSAIGTLRGIHFQVPPRTQAKLVRCIRGRMIDYAVDVRRGSPTYGRWTSAELSADNGFQLFIPVGYAHAFVTLEPQCEVLYKMSDYYSPECDGGIRFDDPDIGIEWPFPSERLVLSPKDRMLPRLAEWESPFEYDGEPLPERLI
ncbi:dTDP-4-dehydrorhamnose 3,5-epimerase [Micromonospora sp. STR1s_5]|nr:dTDP-4-dehydrorhamnose 3,5-epimerase [Micromonospora sp. STR1s_5]